MPYTTILAGQRQQITAKEAIDRAQPGSVVRISEPKRNMDQNAKMWAMLTDVSNAKPDGLEYTPEAWKSLFMHAFGHEMRFMVGLNGEPFPVGFRTSRLSKKQMSDLIEFIYAWATPRGVLWSENLGEDQ